MMKIKPGVLTTFKAYFDETDKQSVDGKITDVSVFLVKDGVKVQNLKTESSEELDWSSSYIFSNKESGDYQVVWEIGVKDQNNKMIKKDNITVLEDNSYLTLPKIEISQEDPLSEIPSDVKAYLVKSQ